MPGQKQNKVILDSSIIAAIFFKEEASEKAEKAVGDRELITLDLAFVEVANVAWKRVVLFKENKDLISKALKNGCEFITDACEVIASKELLGDAFLIAVSEKITIYDALFVAASEIEKLPLLTADGKLYENLKTSKDIMIV
jgi:predicted nucleic acid-binding protein